MSRATFGEFLQAARRHLDGPAATHQPGGTGGSAEEISRSLLRVVTVMRRYLRDIAPSLGQPPRHTSPALGLWAQTCQQATRAASSAARFLNQQPPGQWPLAPAASPLAQRLDAVAMSLATGRDLLHTHFAADTDRTVRYCSEWAPVIASAPVSRALLIELGALARRSAHHGANAALAPLPGTNGSEDTRRRLSAACQWLWVLDSSIRTANQREPVTDADRDLLLEIPVNATPDRPLLTGDQPVEVRREAVTRSAERVRHRAWAATHQSNPPWVTALSLREAECDHLNWPRFGLVSSRISAPPGW